MFDASELLQWLQLRHFPDPNDGKGENGERKIKMDKGSRVEFTYISVIL